MLSLLLSLVLFQTADSTSYLIDEMTGPKYREAFKKWKPGPKVLAEIERINQAGRERFAGIKDDLSNGREIQMEYFRRETIIHVIKAWSFFVKRDEVAHVEVIIYGSPEYRAVFPRGVAHLPKELLPGKLYESTPGSSRRWQYLGTRKWNNVTFAIFRMEVDQ